MTDTSIASRCFVCVCGFYKYVVMDSPYFVLISIRLSYFFIFICKIFNKIKLSLCWMLFQLLFPNLSFVFWLQFFVLIEGFNLYVLNVYQSSFMTFQFCVMLRRSSLKQYPKVLFYYFYNLIFKNIRIFDLSEIHFNIRSRDLILVL